MLKYITMDVNLKLRAFNSKVFKSYDIRGLYPQELDHNTSELIAYGFAEYLRQIDPKPTCLLGKDVRESSEELLELVREKLLSEGVNVVNIGLTTSPMFTFALAESRATGGLMVTASHNSIQYNGFKLFKGTQSLSEKHGLPEIKKIIESNVKIFPRERGSERKENYISRYIDFLLSNSKCERKVKAVFDPGGGSAGIILSSLLKKIQVEPFFSFLDPDPSLLMREPNPLLAGAQEKAREILLKEKAEVAFIYDPDADRVVLLDEKGDVVRGDGVLWLLVNHLCEENDAVVHDILSSLALTEDLESIRVRAIPSRVGHSFIKEAMRDSNAVLGGELSGHFYFKDFFYAESAIFATIKIIEILSKSDKKLSEILAPFFRYCHSGEIDFKSEYKSKILERMAEAYKDGEVSRLDGLTVRYLFWWFNIRPSATEDVLRLVFEAKNKELFEQKKSELLGHLHSLGAKEV